ncbi:MAG: nucleotidyltransferase family protein [Dehalococcoidia bacterium]
MATEDLFGLYEIVWTLNTNDPDARQADKESRAGEAVRTLLAQGLIFLCRGYTVDHVFSQNESYQQLEGGSIWDPADWAEQVHFAATPRGERVYYHIDALLLAAGESTRMGRPKALLSWGATTLIEYQVRELLAARCEVIVVLGHAADEIRPHVPGEALIVVNEAYREGRASSLRAGAVALPDDADTIVVLNVDQPRPREVVRALIGAHRTSGALVTRPTHQGRHGHPLVLSAALLRELRAASEEAQGLRGVVAAHQDAIREVAVDSAVVLLDLNTEDDYQGALAAFGPSLQT